ncbi:hypothetical protein C2G38_2103599, partial [Gigaspora rosea]
VLVTMTEAEYHHDMVVLVNGSSIAFECQLLVLLNIQAVMIRISEVIIFGYAIFLDIYFFAKYLINADSFHL